MKGQKTFNFAIVAIATVLLATTAISGTTTEVFAGKYKNNQAASQANACGNGEIPTNVGCQNTDSMIQGDENGVALTAQQTFPEVRPISDGNGNGGPTNQCPEGTALVTALEIDALDPTATVGPVTICIVIDGSTPLVNVGPDLVTVTLETHEQPVGGACEAGEVVVEAELGDGTTILLCV